MNERDISCGLYRTTEPIEDAIPANVLVYYHNHGDPGPGVYLPKGWKNNRATFEERGTTIPDDDYPTTLEPLLAEGFYRVVKPFYCCERRCQYFDIDLLVQLGYDGDARPILFIPELVDGAVALPAEGTLIDDAQLAQLNPLRIPVADSAEEEAGEVTLQ